MRSIAKKWGVKFDPANQRARVDLHVKCLTLYTFSVHKFVVFFEKCRVFRSERIPNIDKTDFRPTKLQFIHAVEYEIDRARRASDQRNSLLTLPNWKHVPDLFNLVSSILSNYKAHFWNAEKKTPQNDISHDILLLNLGSWFFRGCPSCSFD